MARLPALIDAFLEIDGRDRATIEHTARLIRERGLISTTKRGAGASSMTSADAVNLLLALNASSSPKDGPEAVQRMRQLCVRAKNGDSEGSNIEEPLRQLFDISNFAGALEYLIDFFPNIAEFYGQSVNRVDGYFFSAFEIKIEIHFGYAAITLEQLGKKTNPRYNLFRHYSYPMGSEHRERKFHDRRVVTYLGAETVFALWQCVVSKNVPEA